MRTRFCLFLFGLLLLMTSGCGFFGVGGGGDGDFQLLEFEPDPPTPVPEKVVGLALSINPEILVEVEFLYAHKVHMETLRRINRDLLGLLDYSSPGDVGLDWVIEVHEVTKEMDDFFLLTTSLRVPESQRDQYEYLFVSMLEGVQTMGLGADRLLAASLHLGPSGRTLVNMSEVEQDKFEALILEAEFFLTDSEERIADHMVDLSRVISSMRIR